MRQAYLLSNTENKHLPDWLNRVPQDRIDKLKNEQVSCLLVYEKECEHAYDIIMNIRSEALPFFYLKPVVLIQNNLALSDEIASAFDAVINQNSLTEQNINELSSKFESINQWLDTLGPEQFKTDQSLAFKMLRFLASRDLTISAVATIRSKHGFIYPILETFLGFTDGGVLHTLEYLEQQRLIDGEYQTKVRLCNHCESAFLNFKEVCSLCSNEDIAIDELVHHFKCGYVAELHDYKQGEKLVCPKCDRSLKHIGVDYDKPSIIYRCKSCAHSFQEPKIMTSCFNCNRTTEPENQRQKTIKQYSITSIGYHAARFGLESLFANILKDELQLIDYQNFLQIVEIEGSRIERYKVSESALLLIYFKGLEDIYVHLGSRAGDMFKELSIIFHSVLRSSDIISAKDDAMFAAVLTETDEKNAALVVERLQTGIRELMTENIDEHFELIAEVHPITSPAIDTSLLLENILSRHVH